MAIIGGGLCGLSLAIALTKRRISYIIYEARSSFTEIGAGINLGPNTIQAFNLIDPAISEAIFALATRNEPGKEEVWMNLRLGAPTNSYEDAFLVHELMGPPTGNMTVSRNELLQLLARSIQSENARFNKRVARIEQRGNGATLTFEDGSRDTASIVIGCDGAHSTVRSLMLGFDHPATAPRYSHTGGYRAVFPMHLHEQAVGIDKAHMSTVFMGPGGYVINYPIDGGKNVNIGLWPFKPDEWNHEAWIIPKQKDQMLDDFQQWGETIQKLMSMMDDETAFWATFHHSVKPDSYFKGRICTIGDAAHSMCPHQGQGAAQSMEDACVLAEVLDCIGASKFAAAQTTVIEAAFSGFETARKPRFEKALDTSSEAHSFWGDLWRPDLSDQDLKAFRDKADERFRWLWNPEIGRQCERAKAEMQELLEQRAGAGRRASAKLA